MQLVLYRTYLAEGTNGILFVDGETTPLCYTIELPWRYNQVRISCIPHGTYPVTERYSPHFKWHLHVQQVPGRSLILIHPANNARNELQGCIAPVSVLTGAGTGDNSRQALQKLMLRVAGAVRRNEPIFLTIGSGYQAGPVLNPVNEKDHTTGRITYPTVFQEAA